MVYECALQAPVQVPSLRGLAGRQARLRELSGALSCNQQAVPPCIMVGARCSNCGYTMLQYSYCKEILHISCGISLIIDIELYNGL